MELVQVMRSQWAQALILSPSCPVPLQDWDSRENPFSSSEFFPEESVTCQKAEWGVGELLAPDSKVVRMVRTCSYLLGNLEMEESVLASGSFWHSTLPTKGLGTKSLASASSDWTQ